MTDRHRGEEHQERRRARRRLGATAGIAALLLATAVGAPALLKGAGPKSTA
ncbi:hypothetical protein ACFT0G_06545 [Streptomyces sp. NPDC057020]|uniref:hypothetical protein n=1 Tax=unclassified Streptomyces TaxID=2593676 RepID=UPI00363AA58B